MKMHMAYSSGQYFLKTAEVKALNKAENYSDGDEVIILLGSIRRNKAETLLSGEPLLKQAQEQGQERIAVRVAYLTPSLWLGFFINLIKPLKRKYQVEGLINFHIRLEDLNHLHLARGVRNEKNAYNWTNKKWAMTEEERQTRYQNLYQSLKEKGYDDKSPLFVMANRSLGVRDQLLQGHHRINICKEVGIKEVTVRFWSAVASPKFMTFIEKIISFCKRVRQ